MTLHRKSSRHQKKGQDSANRPVRTRRLGIEPLEGRWLLSTGSIGASDGVEPASIVGPQIIDGRQSFLRPEVAMVGFLDNDGKVRANGSGTFISRQHILTAAHVVDFNDDFRYDSHDPRIIVRTSRFADVRIAGFSEYRVTSVTIAGSTTASPHDDYRIEYDNGKFVRARNDLAILRLETLAHDVTPIPLSREAPIEGDWMEILGFGQTGTRGGSPATPNGWIRHNGVAEVDDVSNLTFSRSLDPGFAGTAPGDSGGPSFIYWDGETASLAGVHSYGDTTPTAPGAQSTDMRVDRYAGWIDSVLASDFSSGPTATVLNHDDITSPSSLIDNVRLKYSDVNGISESNLTNPHIALVGPNNYYNQYPNIGLVVRSTDGTELTVSYRFNGPGGVWRPVDNGTYEVVLLNRGLTDGLGNPTGSRTLTSFRVNLPPDSSAPTASFVSTTLPAAGPPTFVARVRFDDDIGIDAKSLGNDDVRLVKAGGGYSVGGRLMIGSAIRNSSVLSMLYEFPAPGGSWNAADNGTYNVVVQGGSVRDVSGNSIAGRTLGTLTVNFPGGTPISPWATLNAADITTQTNTHTFTITYADDVAIAVASVLDDRQEVFVEPSGGLGEFAELVSVSQQSNGTPIVATYRVTFSQTWRPADNGVDFEVSLFSGGVSGTVTDTSGNRVRAPYLGAFKVRLASGPPDATAPQATTSAMGVSLQSDQPHWFAALFSDDQAVEATTIVPDSLFVVGPNGQEHPLMLANVNYGQNVPHVLATFGVQPPGGAWDAADDGVYRIAVRDGTVRDTSGNAIPGYITEVPAGGEIGTFLVAISDEPQPDSADALLSITPLQTEAASHTFTVTYTSDTGIDVTSLGSDDIYVTDNEDYLKFAEFVGVDVNTNGSPRVATYRISGPNGPWTTADNKTYEVYVAGIEAPTVRSLGDNHVHAGFLGNLVVNIVAAPLPPEMDIRGNGQSITDGDMTPTSGDHTDFGTTSVNGAVVVRTFTIANTGTGTLTLSGNPMVQISGAGAGDFSVTSLPGSAIITGGSTTFQITFDPTSAGVRTATVSIANNDGDENPYNFAIQGNGAAAPEIDVRGNGISIVDGDTTPSTGDNTNFGMVNVGNQIRIRTFTIANSGGAALALTGRPAVQISGAHAGDFSVDFLPASSVSPGGSTTFQIAFDPSAGGVRTATVSIFSNDGDESPYDFAIQGTGDADVGDILANARVTSLVNTGSLNLQELIGNGGNFNADVDLYRFSAQAGSRVTASTAAVAGGLLFDSYLRLFDAGGAQLAANDDSGEGLYSQIADFLLPHTGIYYLGVSGFSNTQYNPVTGDGLRGAQTGDYRLLVDLFGSFPEMDVRGLGLSIASGDLTPSLADQTDFGNVDVLDVIAGVGFTIANTGTGVLSLSGNPRVQISGPAAADFSISIAPADSVSAGGLTSFFVSFNPSAVGLRTATVSIANNDPNEGPYVFAIQGTGVAVETSPPLLITGSGAGGEARVRLFDSSSRVEYSSFLPFGPGFRGGVRAAMGDVNGDGSPDTIAAAGPGGGPHVRVFDGRSGEQLPGAIGSFFAFGLGFTGGVFVASGDVNDDGWDDVIAAAGAGGGPHVRVFSGRDGAELRSFFAYGVTFTGGVTVAAGDLNGDGRADIVTGAGPGGGPHVRVFSGATGQQLAGPAASFFAYGLGFTGGVWVASGDVNADGRDDIITGAGAGGGPHVRVISGADGSELHSYFAYAPGFLGGVRVGTVDANGDGRADIITGAGPGGGPHVRIFSGLDRSELASLFADDPAFTGGVFIAGDLVEPGATPPRRTPIRVLDGEVTPQQHMELIRGAALSSVDSELDAPQLPGDEVLDALYAQWR